MEIYSLQFMNKVVKTLIILLFLINIIFQKSEWVFDRCDFEIARQALSSVIWYEQTIDGQNQPHVVTRFLHNKAGVYLSQFGKCYFQAIDPYLLYKTVGIAGIFSIFFLTFITIDRKNYLVLTLLFLLPILPFFKFATNFQIVIYKILATIGLYFFFKKLK